MNGSALTWSKLCIRLLAALALFFALNVLVYYTHPFFAQERQYYATVKGLFARNSAHILLLGDSHVGQLDNAYLVDTAYNAAFGGDSLRECYAKLHYLLQRDPDIDTLIITADYHMFGTGRMQSSNRTFVDRYLLLSGTSVGLDNGVASAIRQQIPLFNDDFVQFLRAQIRPRSREQPDEQGAASVWSDLEESTREEIAESVGRMDHRGVGEWEEPFEWYERIVELARQHGVRIVAVRYPAEPAYFLGLSEEGAAKVDKEFERLGISSILDFRRSLTSPEQFKDSDHVSAEGARDLLMLMESRLGIELLRREITGA